MAAINSDYTNLYIEDELAVGRVEVCWGGQYRPVCQNGWNNQSASVVCRQLGFSPYGQLHENILCTVFDKMSPPFISSS